MKFSSCIKFCTSALLLMVTAVNAMCQPISPEKNPGQFLIQLKSAESTELIPGLVQSFSNTGLMPVKQLSRHMNIWLFQFDPAVSDAESLLTKVRQHPAVHLAQFNHRVTEREFIPDDPSFVNEWGLKNTGQMNGTPGADIRATYAWDITSSGLTINGDTIVIAMVDGGVDLGHTDLKLWKNRLEIPYNGVDDDGNGFIDDYHGWNAYMNSGNMQQSDHGTHVAGIAAAKGNNNRGVTGVAFNTYLMPVAGSGTNEDVVVVAYDYVLEMRKRYDETGGSAGAFIVATNSSFGVDAGNPANYPLWGAMYDSLGALGILNVASTANRGWDVDINGDIPTSMTNESIVSVTNTTNTDILNTQAAWGQNSIDLGAPGTSIYSTRQGDTYGYKTGTSMSSPFVSGSIALMYAAAGAETMQLYAENPVLVASRFKRYLIASVDSLPALDGITVSGGRLNLLNTLQMVQNPPYITSNPPEITLVMEQNASDTVSLQLTSHNSEFNTYTVEIPDTIHWAYAEVPGGLLNGSIPGTLRVVVNTENLSLGSHATTMTIRDHFLNELIINLEVKVEEEVRTRLISPETSSFSCSPNPVTTSALLSFTLDQASDVSLTAWNLTGTKVDDLFRGFLSSGSHTMKWNPAIVPGVYLIRLATDESVRVIKAIKR